MVCWKNQNKRIKIYPEQESSVCSHLNNASSANPVAAVPVTTMAPVTPRGDGSRHTLHGLNINHFLGNSPGGAGAGPSSPGDQAGDRRGEFEERVYRFNPLHRFIIPPYWTAAHHLGLTLCSASSYAVKVQAVTPTTVTPVRRKCSDWRGGQPLIRPLTVSLNSQSKLPPSATHALCKLLSERKAWHKGCLMAKTKRKMWIGLDLIGVKFVWRGKTLMCVKLRLSQSGGNF